MCCTSITSLLPSFLPAEFQRQESVRSQHKSIQLYDTPYEPEGQSVDSDSESTVSPRLRESKLPQDDDRPADEYDQPWEWNRVTIPALAGKASGPVQRWPLTRIWHSPLGKGVSLWSLPAQVNHGASTESPLELSSLLVQLGPSNMMGSWREGRPAQGKSWV